MIDGQNSLQRKCETHTVFKGTHLTVVSPIHLPGSRKTDLSPGVDHKPGSAPRTALPGAPGKP